MNALLFDVVEALAMLITRPISALGEGIGTLLGFVIIAVAPEFIILAGLAGLAGLALLIGRWPQ